MLEAAKAAEEPQRPFTSADVANKALVLEIGVGIRPPLNPT